MIGVKMPNGDEMPAYLALPRSRKAPGIVLLQEIAGVNFHLRAAADYFAALDYVVLAPNVFWRLDPHHAAEYTPEGSQRSLDLLDRFDDAQGVADIAVAIAALRGMERCSGAVAAVGYCLGGRLAFLCAVAGTVDAAAGLYPTWIERCIDQARETTCPVSLHFPEIDTLSAPDADARIAKALEGRDNIEAFHYPGAHHAYDSDARRTLYDRWASQLTNSRIALFLDRTIGSSR